MGNNVIPFPRRGRPESTLALFMHVTALALDLAAEGDPRAQRMVEHLRVINGRVERFGDGVLAPNPEAA